MQSRSIESEQTRLIKELKDIIKTRTTHETLAKPALKLNLSLNELDPPFKGNLKSWVTKFNKVVKDTKAQLQLSDEKTAALTTIESSATNLPTTIERSLQDVDRHIASFKKNPLSRTFYDIESLLQDAVLQTNSIISSLTARSQLMEPGKEQTTHNEAVEKWKSAHALLVTSAIALFLDDKPQIRVFTKELTNELNTLINNKPKLAKEDVDFLQNTFTQIATEANKLSSPNQSLQTQALTQQLKELQANLRKFFYALNIPENHPYKKIIDDIFTAELTKINQGKAEILNLLAKGDYSTAKDIVTDLKYRTDHLEHNVHDYHMKLLKSGVTKESLTLDAIRNRYARDEDNYKDFKAIKELAHQLYKAVDDLANKNNPANELVPPLKNFTPPFDAVKLKDCFTTLASRGGPLSQFTSSVKNQLSRYSACCSQLERLEGNKMSDYRGTHQLANDLIEVFNHLAIALSAHYENAISKDAKINEQGIKDLQTAFTNQLDILMKNGPKTLRADIVELRDSLPPQTPTNAPKPTSNVYGPQDHTTLLHTPTRTAPTHTPPVPPPKKQQ